MKPPKGFMCCLSICISALLILGVIDLLIFTLSKQQHIH